MKFSDIFNIVISSAAALAVAAPLASAGAEPDANNWCHRRGEPCSKMKRAANAAAEALAAAEPGPISDADAAARNWCWRRGEPCSRAKRDAVSLAEAVAEAHAVAEEDEIELDKRDAEADNGAKDRAKANAPPRGQKAINALQEMALRGEGITPLPNTWCYRNGEPCFKVKRAAAAIADALAEAAPEPRAGAEAEARNWCWRRGEPCSKAKRGLEHLEEQLEKFAAA